jgi:hypothetical protein
MRLSLSPQENPTPTQSTLLYEGYMQTFVREPPLREPGKDPVGQDIHDPENGLWYDVAPPSIFFNIYIYIYIYILLFILVILYLFLSILYLIYLSFG